MYDAIVVGARCAGSPTAMHLVQKGYRVLMVDRAVFPSNKTLSTHVVLRSGCAVLKRLGLLEQVHTSNCPPIREFVLDFGEARTVASPPMYQQIDAMYAPRRLVLDNILVEGAIRAGVEFRPGFTVDEFLYNEGRIVGIRGRQKGSSRTHDEYATIVIGADGINSKLAETVNAPKYHEVPTRSAVYFSYWSDVLLETGVIIHFRPGRLLPAVSTNDGLTLIMDYFPRSEFTRFRSDIEGNFLNDWKNHAPEFHERMMQGRRESQWIGTDHQPNYFRKPYGPGWALIGDADIHHDSINPSGITYALVNAELLADAIHAGLAGHQPMETALAHYEMKRLQRWLPHYQFLTQFATLEPPTPPELALFSSVLNNSEVASNFLGFFEGHEDRLDFLSPENLQLVIRA